MQVAIANDAWWWNISIYVTYCMYVRAAFNKWGMLCGGGGGGGSVLGYILVGGWVPGLGVYPAHQQGGGVLDVGPKGGGGGVS